MYKSRYSYNTYFPDGSTTLLANSYQAQSTTRPLSMAVQGRVVPQNGQCPLPKLPCSAPAPHYQAWAILPIAGPLRPIDEKETRWQHLLASRLGCCFSFPSKTQQWQEGEGEGEAAAATPTCCCICLQQVSRPSTHQPQSWVPWMGAARESERWAPHFWWIREAQWPPYSEGPPLLLAEKGGLSLSFLSSARM